MLRGRYKVHLRPRYQNVACAHPKFVVIPQLQTLRHQLSSTGINCRPLAHHLAILGLPKLFITIYIIVNFTLSTSSITRVLCECLKIYKCMPEIGCAYLRSWSCQNLSHFTVWFKALTGSCPVPQVRSGERRLEGACGRERWSHPVFKYLFHVMAYG